MGVGEVVAVVGHLGGHGLEGFDVVYNLLAEVKVKIHHLIEFFVDGLDGRAVGSIDDGRDDLVDLIFIDALDVGAVRCSEDSI